MSAAQAKVVTALIACRTAALGGHVAVCETCGYESVSYNSCRNRHCPKCQGGAAAAWVEAQREHLLPVPYAHVVFTLPDELAPLALQNPERIYGLLFRAASQTLLQVGSTPRHLGARLGFLAILHTWGQNLLHHPHVHCVVPAGGLALDGSRWVACRKGFFLPVRVLGRLYRGKFLALLQKAYAAGELQFHGRLADLAEPRRFQHLVAEARAHEWVVYAKPPFGGPEAVLKYLARYTHRIAVSNHRLLSFADDRVSFTWKDYRHGHRRRVMVLDSVEFARRFLMHVLPKRFVKIRYYGFLAQSRRGTMLRRCREVLHVQPAASDASGDASHEPIECDTSTPPEHTLCPSCQRGRLVYDHDVPFKDSS